MAEGDAVATDNGVTGQEGTINGEPAREDRMSDMERIAARRAQQVADSAATETAKTEPAPTEPAPAKVDEPGDQLRKQLDDAPLVLDADALSRAMVKTVVDGKEELVPAAKALAQYQKGAAADVRLAEATRLSREAEERLRQIEAREAATKAQLDAQTRDTTSATLQDEIVELTKQHASALYAGEEEKAAKLLSDIVGKRVAVELAGRTQESAIQVTPDQLVEQALPALKQRLSVDSALDQLKSDYPEIWSDPDMALLADSYRARHEAEGLSRADAIAKAGEDVGKKYGIGKFKKADVAADGSTTREQKLAAKQGLDEPTSANARAATPVVLPKTNSQVIAEMAAARSHASR